MKIKLLALIASLVLTQPVFAQTVSEHTTDAGHKFHFHHMPDSSRVGIAIAWKGGIANLPAGQENLATLAIDLMLNGGADGRKPDDIRAEFEAMDAGSHLYSDTDAIRGFVVAPTKDLQRAAEIANSVLSKPTMDARWFKRMLRNSKKNVEKNASYINTQAWHTIRHLTMGGHRLEQSWSWQPAAALDALTVEGAQQWVAESFSTNDLVINVAGNAEIEAIAKALDTTLQGLPNRHKRGDLEPLKMTYSGKTVLIHKPEEEKSYMVIVGPLPAAAHADNLAIQLGAGVLGQSEQSRLFKAVRDEQRAAYGFGSQIYAFTRAQDMLSLAGEVETGKIAPTLAAIEDAYETFRTGGIGRLEFPFAKRIMLKRIRENFAKPSSRAFVMTEAALTGQLLEEALALEDKANEMSRSQANTAIAAHFPKFEGMLKVIVSPDAKAVEADCVITDFTQAGQCF